MKAKFVRDAVTVIYNFLQLFIILYENYDCLVAMVVMIVMFNIDWYGLRIKIKLYKDIFLINFAVFGRVYVE